MLGLQKKRLRLGCPGVRAVSQPKYPLRGTRESRWKCNDQEAFARPKYVGIIAGVRHEDREEEKN
jgi:hypothetical protein